MAQDKARLGFEHDSAVARLTLAAPKGNVIDADMIGAVEKALSAVQQHAGLKLLVLDADGPNFSFGASIEEHLGDAIRGALARLHHVIRRLQDVPAVTLAAVRGQCLGGGLELALGCDLMLVEASARLGIPEIKLGVFPPAASVLLPLRVGCGPAADLLLTGRSVSGNEAFHLRLAQRVAEEGALEAALQAWLGEDFLPRSGTGLRHAAAALRLARKRALGEDLAALERRYLDEMMAEADAEEGIRAFLEKRAPRWTATPAP